MKNLMTILMVAVLLCLCGSAQAAVLNVPGDSNTIQAAIDAASYGDTVAVAAGTYEENITLKNGVAVIGVDGSLDTIIDGNDANSVVTAIGCDASTVLEGFTITGGNAKYGGGMYNEDSNTTITSCTFSGNLARYGGGMYNEDSNTTITSCTFSDNTASDEYRADGGGIYNLRSSSTVTNCTFSGNSANWGGGMYIWNCIRPTVTNCMFTGNTAGYAAGGICNGYSDTIVTDCTFTDNTAYRGGGMFHYLSISPATITNCTFTGNTAGETGGGMHNYNELSPTTVTNCTFSSNSAIRGGGMCNEGDSAIVTNCEFSGNSAYYGGGMINWGYSTAHVEATVTNCTFSGNTAVNFGGGMYNRQLTRPIITNCIMWGNTAADGNEISNSGDLTTPLISYSDIAGCGGEWTGVGPLGLDRGGNIDEDPLFVAPGWWDNNSTPEDPADDIWVNGDYHLSPDSPCIDAGDKDAVSGVTTDLDGNPRITNDVVDMGAYEYCEYEPEIDVSPLAWDFADVNLGEDSSMLFTIENKGNGDLTVYDIYFTPDSNTEFTIPSPPTVPLVIAAGDSNYVEVVFAPSAEECYWADLVIESNDVDESVVTVELDGCGVPVEIPPSEQIQAIKDFIEDGNVAGTGGQPDKKIEVLVNMVEAVGGLIAAEDLEKACQQLSIVLQKCDGEIPPADFVQDAVGGATEELEGMIEELMEDLGC